MSCVPSLKLFPPLTPKHMFLFARLCNGAPVRADCSIPRSAPGSLGVPQPVVVNAAAAEHRSSVMILSICVPFRWRRSRCGENRTVFVIVEFLATMEGGGARGHGLLLLGSSALLS